ncbi:MAG: PEP-CTERM sorting domain-containing protein [Nitrosomonas sp.]|nr:PEP-CTERM sorting domain-containing protein [Nitrosomonas sp.]MCW5608612.1 PEP-CTERM sorting domain-containing protein [Nitrosomonas sp.]
MFRRFYTSSTAIPELSSILLLSIGGGIGMMFRRKRNMQRCTPCNYA